MKLFKGKTLFKGGTAVVTDDEKIDEALSRGVENVFPNVEFVKSLLKKGKQLTIYLGIDPTGPNIHLGHVIPMRKLSPVPEAWPQDDFSYRRLYCHDR